jgi:hypothetical protein
MASLAQYVTNIHAALAQCDQATSHQDPPRRIFVEGYMQALEDFKTAWEHAPAWNQDLPNNAFPSQLARIQSQLEQRLTGQAGGQPMAAALGGVPREGGP